ncbi:MAG TPA: hypothetical protein PK919_08900 [Candidatus Aminicenantes bacterium]|nr:hypothetical protein [Candidatus Aminicenantes bacterium]
MKPSNSRKLFFAFLLFFFTFIAFINFFHSDSILEKEPDCPACCFQQSHIALAIILFLFLVVFTSLSLLVTFDSIAIYFFLPSPRRPRAPPPAFS